MTKVPNPYAASAEVVRQEIELQAHLDSRPIMPRPFDPNGHAEILFQRALNRWVDDRDEMVDRLRNTRDPVTKSEPRSPLGQKIETISLRENRLHQITITIQSEPRIQRRKM